MFRFKLTLMLMGILLLTLALVPSLQAQCRTTAYTSMPYDSYSEQTDGPYNMTCNNSFAWTFNFHRTSQTNPATTVRWWVTDQNSSTVYHQEYYSGDFPANDNYSLNEYYTFPSSNTTHTLHLKNIGTNTGLFTNLSISLSYYTPPDSKPPR